MGFEMGGEPIERVLHQGLVSDGCRAAGKAREPRRALSVVGKEAVDIGAYHTAIGRDRALGHAIGSSGTRVLTTLIYALRQRTLTRGIASLCLGGGNGVALAIELL